MVCYCFKYFSPYCMLHWASLCGCLRNLPRKGPSLQDICPIYHCFHLPCHFIIINRSCPYNNIRIFHFSTIAFASSFIVHLPVFWHARHPLQNFISLSFKDTNSTLWPASFAPRSVSYARISEFALFLKNFYRISTIHFRVYSKSTLP